MLPVGDLVGPPSENVIQLLVSGSPLRNEGQKIGISSMAPCRAARASDMGLCDPEYLQCKRLMLKLAGERRIKLYVAYASAVEHEDISSADISMVPSGRSQHDLQQSEKHRTPTAPMRIAPFLAVYHLERSYLHARHRLGHLRQL